MSELTDIVDTAIEEAKIPNEVREFLKRESIYAALIDPTKYYESRFYKEVDVWEQTAEKTIDFVREVYLEHGPEGRLQQLPIEKVEEILVSVLSDAGAPRILYHYKSILDGHLNKYLPKPEVKE